MDGPLLRVERDAGPAAVVNYDCVTLKWDVAPACVGVR